MSTIVNGMSATDVPGAVWRRSIRSGAQGNCVEVAELPTGTIAMRNSRDPDGPALVFTRDEMNAFVAGAKAGEFDVPAARDGSHDRVPATDIPAPNPRDEGAPVRYQMIGTELNKLIDQLLEGETVLDREASERLLRILSGVALLHRMHRVDRNGNCAVCKTKSRGWHPSRHAVCSVYAAMSLYLGRSLMASAESPEAGDRAGEEVGERTETGERSWAPIGPLAYAE